jgi:hypothetical protein
MYCILPLMAVTLKADFRNQYVDLQNVTGDERHGFRNKTPASGEMTGNFPRAFSHIGLINAVGHHPGPAADVGIERHHIRRAPRGRQYRSTDAVP